MLDYACCWYLNESSRHEESEYVIILIEGSVDIGVFGTGRVKSLMQQKGKPYVI